MAEHNNFQVRPGGMQGGPYNRFSNKSEKLKNPKQTTKRVLSYMSEYQPILVFTFILCAITAIISIIGTRLNGYALDHCIDTGNMESLLWVCIILGTIYMVGVLSTYLQNRFMVKIAQRTAADIRKDLYFHVQKLSVPYYDSHSSGDLMSRLTNDIDNINMTLSQNITQLFSGIVTIIGMLIAMLLLCPPLLLVGMITLPFVFGLSKLIVKKTQPYFVAQQRELGNINGYIEERISGQKVILLFGKEELTKEEFRNMNQKLKISAMKAQAFSGILGPMNNMVNNFTYFIVAVSGAYFILTGMGITVGIVFSFVLYMRNFISPINQILNMFNTIQSALAGAERVFEVMDEPTEEMKEGNTKEYSFNGDVDIHQIDFSYNNQKQILRNVDIHVKRGETVAIVGPTGSGKTTIMNLLTRFYDVDKGSIQIDGRDIRTLDKHGLRKQIAMVLQDTFLFTASVRENIRYGKLCASDEQVEQAAQVANAHSFITQLPDGYDTILTDNGSNLSQGERQLLAIARAVLTESSILILDEATSSIDTRTEIKIQEAMLHLMKGKTTFIIAHRLSTIKNADEILALKDGEIIERGTHDELMRLDGFYANLCKTQYKGIAI